MCEKNQSNLNKQGNFLTKQKQLEEEKGAPFQIEIFQRRNNYYFYMGTFFFFLFLNLKHKTLPALFLSHQIPKN